MLIVAMLAILNV